MLSAVCGLWLSACMLSVDCGFKLVCCLLSVGCGYQLVCCLLYVVVISSYVVVISLYVVVINSYVVVISSYVVVINSYVVVISSYVHLLCVLPTERAAAHERVSHHEHSTGSAGPGHSATSPGVVSAHLRTRSQVIIMYFI